MKAFTKSLLALVIAFGLLAIGGAALLAVDEAPDADPPATLTVAHFAPFGATITDTSVSVFVNGSEKITDFVFAEKVSGIQLPGGTYTIAIAPTGVTTPAITGTVTVSNGQQYFLAAIGGANTWPLELYALPVDTTPFTATGKLRITHLAPFAPLAPLTRVDICAQPGNTPVPGLTGIAYKDTTGYLPLAAGIYDLFISPANTNCLLALDLPPFALAKGQVADVFAIGLLSPADPALGLQVSQDGLKSRAKLAHFAPFANTITGTSVTVRVAGSDLITGFVFPQYTPYLDLPLGSYPVEIIPTGSITPAITGTVVISGFLDYTFAAIGDVVNQPLELFRLVDDNATPPPAGQGRLRIGHLAPFNASIPATAVDICATVGGTPLLDNVEYKDVAPLNLAAGIYSGVFIANPSPNCALPLVTLPPFLVLPGQVAYVYAVGDGINVAPTVVTDPDLSVKPVYLPIVGKDANQAQ